MDQLQPHPRIQNAYTQDGKPPVSRVPHLNGDYVPATVKQALSPLGGLGKAVCPGDRVMIKPNFNCSCALPLSTDLTFLTVPANTRTEQETIF